MDNAFIRSLRSYSNGENQKAKKPVNPYASQNSTRVSNSRSRTPPIAKNKAIPITPPSRVLYEHPVKRNSTPKGIPL
jgi:hypothetical protein